jgi:4-amino-4-deoxy-L-arabinose transferase-like glycosyltransferase
MKKEADLNQTSKTLNFWFCGGLLAILFISITARDIARPFYGLHSWAQASGAWAARSHVRYGLSYTKGVSTWAVGYPPKAAPQRYWDHPQLNVLVAAGFMEIFGINEWASGIGVLIVDVLALLIFIFMIRDISNDLVAIISGAIYILFPLTSYFGMGSWTAMLGYLSMWLYLIITGRTARNPKRFHYICLAIALFLGIQFDWSVFFFAMGIGVHYVLVCLIKRKSPNWPLLIILAAAPACSMLLNFTIMAAGYNWDVSKITNLYKWRSAKGEMPAFEWDKWFAQLWEFAVTNFTIPALIAAIFYLTIGQLFVLTAPKNETSKKALRFPCFWLFFLIPFFQLFILRGCLWRHQTWEQPLTPLIAIGTTLAILMIDDILKKIHRYFALAVDGLLVIILLVSCLVGAHYYYSIRWQPEAKIKMFKMLNKEIPPDKALLSYEDFIVNQNEAKGGFIRPEIAWYLDRDIVPATTFQQVQELSKTGEYPYYLVPYHPSLAELINQLKQLYTYEYVAGDPGETTKDGKFLKAGMLPYMIFDLRSKK